MNVTEVFCVLLPVRIESEANQREHWGTKARRVKQHRQAALVLVKHAMRNYSGERPVGAKVTLTRIAPRPLDGDNLQGALKACRDGVADALGFRDDSDPRLTWVYAQRASGKAHDYAAEVVIEVAP